MARVSSEPGGDGGRRGGDHPSGVGRGLRHLQCTLGKIHGLEEEKEDVRQRLEVGGVLTHLPGDPPATGCRRSVDSGPSPSPSPGPSPRPSPLPRRSRPPDSPRPAPQTPSTPPGQRSPRTDPSWTTARTTERCFSNVAHWLGLDGGKHRSHLPRLLLSGATRNMMFLNV